MQTHRRKIVRDILSRKARTALVSISIFIGVLGVVTLFSMGNILVNRMEETVQEDKLAMTRSYVTLTGSQAPDTEADLAALGQLPHVTQVQGMALYPFYWKMDGATEFEEGRIFSYSQPFDQLAIEPTSLVDGRYPITGQHEIAVERRFAEEHGVGVGDTIILRILTESANQTTEEAWTIVGTIYQAYQYPVALGAPAVVRGETMIFADHADAQYIGGFQGFNILMGRYTNFKAAEAGKGEWDVTLANKTAYRATSTVAEDPAKNSFIEQTRSFTSVLGLLAIVALLVSGFLVFNVINSIVLEQRRQIGVMKSLGATGGDSFGIYAGMAFVYGVMGVIPGVLLGIPLGYSAAVGIGKQYNIFLDKFTVSPSAIVVGVVLGLLVPVLASTIPVLLGIRITILQAMTDLGIQGKYGRGPIAKFMDNFPLPLGMRQSTRNVIQKKGRLALTIVTLAVAAGAFMGIYAMLTSLNKTVDEIYDTFGNEITLLPTSTQDPQAIRDIIMNNVEGVKAVEPATQVSIEIDGFSPTPVGNAPPVLYAIGTEATNRDLLNFQLRDGQDWDANPNLDGIVVTAGIADALDKQAGDTVTVHIGSATAELQIIGITTYPFDTVWAKWQTLAELGGLKNANGALQPNGFSIMLNNPDPTTQEVADIISNINDVLLARGINASYINWTENAEETGKFIATFAVIMNTAAALIAAVGAIGLLSTLAMSVFERQKEIGVMRSIGATSVAVALQFLIEGLIVGVVAWVIGVPIGYMLNQSLAESLNFGDAFAPDYPVLVTIIGLTGTLMVATIASLWPSAGAARKTVSDILRYQ
ncbi:MAG: FtsX-like permease family protein [Chloroflexi bacterium]|nr:FtsX-like permease family protein [Chloroflexota bacterium]